MYDMIKLTDKIRGTTTMNIKGRTKIDVFHEACLTSLSFVAICRKISDAPIVREKKLVAIVKIWAALRVPCCKTIEI